MMDLVRLDEDPIVQPVTEQVMDRITGDVPTLARRIQSGSLHYGDPPNMQCCPAGPTMNCEDLHVLEYWIRKPSRVGKVITEWHQVPDLELDLDPTLWGRAQKGQFPFRAPGTSAPPHS
jgi:hypothetical protein